MLNFAEQTGSGAVILVWSFLLRGRNFVPIACLVPTNFGCGGWLFPSSLHLLLAGNTGGKGAASITILCRNELLFSAEMTVASFASSCLFFALGTTLVLATRVSAPLELPAGLLAAALDSSKIRS